VKRTRDRDADALVTMRLETFIEWFAPSPVAIDVGANEEVAA